MAYEIRESLKRVQLKCYDYRQIISDGDIAVFCDTPDLVPLNRKLGREVYLGPLTWSMANSLPDWWGTLNENKRWIFIGLGSSGDINLLPMIVSTLAKLDVEIIVATSGRKVDLDSYSNVYTSNFLPLEKVIHKFALVIGNGGSPIVHSALNGGVPSLGIICNNDQLFNMAHIEKRGAGLILRNWNITSNSLLAAVNRILTENSFQAAAKSIQKEFQLYNVPELINQITADNCQ